MNESLDVVCELLNLSCPNCPNREMSFPPTIKHIQTYMSDFPPKKQILWWNNFCINFVKLPFFREVSCSISLFLIYILFLNIQWADHFNKHFLISWGLILSGLHDYRKENLAKPNTQNSKFHIKLNISGNKVRQIKKNM